MKSPKVHSMKIYGVAYVVSAVVFLGLDAIWLSLAAQRLYRPLMGDILLERFNLAPAILFYAIYVAGIVFFVISPALAAGRNWMATAFSGALLGFLAYATYDLTNQATLRNWPVAITIADLCWGTFLTAVTATAGYAAARAFTQAQA